MFRYLLFDDAFVTDLFKVCVVTLLAMHDSSDDDDDDFWGIEKQSPESLPVTTSAKKGDIKLSFSIPSLTTSPVTTGAFESTLNKHSTPSQSYDKIFPNYQSPSSEKPPNYSKQVSTENVSESFIEYNDSSLYADEDKSDLHDILDALLNFESTIEPPTGITLTDPYTHSLSLAPIDNYGNTSRRQEVVRENSRLAKQINRSKPCISRSSSSHGINCKSTSTNSSTSRTRLTRIEQENLNLLKRIQSAKSSKAISRREHDKHFESHKVYGRISSKQRTLDSSPATKSMSNLSKPEWMQ